MIFSYKFVCRVIGSTLNTFLENSTYFPQILHFFLCLPYKALSSVGHLLSCPLYSTIKTGYLQNKANSHFRTVWTFSENELIFDLIFFQLLEICWKSLDNLQSVILGVKIFFRNSVIFTNTFYHWQSAERPTTLLQNLTHVGRCFMRF